MLFDQWQMFVHRLGVPPCETSINHDVLRSQVTDCGRWPSERSDALVRYLAIPTVRLTSRGFHHVRTLRRSSADGINSTWREKIGGDGKSATLAPLLAWNQAYPCRFIEPLYAMCTHTFSKCRSSSLGRDATTEPGSMSGRALHRAPLGESHHVGEPALALHAHTLRARRAPRAPTTLNQHASSRSLCETGECVERT